MTGNQTESQPETRPAMSVGEMFAWQADGAGPDLAAAAIGTLPPPARLVYRAIWRPRYNRTSHW